MRQLARWGILIGAFIVAAVVYGVWKKFDTEMGGGFVSGFFRGAVVFGFLVWVWHATKKFGEKAANFSAIAPIESHGTTQTQTVVDEERVYAVIAEELESGVADKGLWTRLFAECGGDEKQTKVLYIKQRADRLISAERLRLEQVGRQQTDEAAKRESSEYVAITTDQSAVSFEGVSPSVAYLILAIVLLVSIFFYFSGINTNKPIVEGTSPAETVHASNAATVAEPEVIQRIPPAKVETGKITADDPFDETQLIQQIPPGNWMTAEEFFKDDKKVPAPKPDPKAPTVAEPKAIQQETGRLKPWEMNWEGVQPVAPPKTTTSPSKPRTTLSDFDVNGAKKAGYSDTEILDYLSKSGKLAIDLAAARKAGYSDAEILNGVLPAKRN